jgi:hypothetical protein
MGTYSPTFKTSQGTVVSLNKTFGNHMVGQLLAIDENSYNLGGIIVNVTSRKVFKDENNLEVTTILVTKGKNIMGQEIDQHITKIVWTVNIGENLEMLENIKVMNYLNENYKNIVNAFEQVLTSGHYVLHPSLKEYSKSVMEKEKLGIKDGIDVSSSISEKHKILYGIGNLEYSLEVANNNLKNKDSEWSFSVEQLNELKTSFQRKGPDFKGGLKLSQMNAKNGLNKDNGLNENSNGIKKDLPVKGPDDDVLN